MNWNFRKVGTIRDALNASVQAEPAPQVIKAEICRRIDSIHVYSSEPQASPQNSQSNVLPKGQCIYVASHGHLDSEPQPYRGTDEIAIGVWNIPLIDTSLS